MFIISENYNNKNAIKGNEPNIFILNANQII